MPSHETPFISIVIPACNEETSLRKLLPALDAEVRSIPEGVEVLIVDDASCDATNAVIRDFIQDKPWFHLIERKTRGGQTGCYQLAFRQARGQYIIRMDADYQDDPADLPQFVEKIREGNEIVVGLRSRRNHDLLQIFGTRVFDLLALIFMRSPFFANTSSFVAFKAELVKDIPLKRTFFFRNEHRYLVLIALSRGPKLYTEIIVKHHPRCGGRSKYRRVGKYARAFLEFWILLFRIKTGYYRRCGETSL